MPASFMLSDAELTQRSAAVDYAMQVIEQLPRLSRTVIALHYVERMTLAEIGEALGVGEARARSVHDAALVRIKTGLAL